MCFSNRPVTAITWHREEKRGRDAAWCNPTEGHHASRLNNVFPMPCQTFSRLWATRQTLQPHSMKQRSHSMVRNSLFDPDITPQIPQRWHSYTHLYVSWMLTSSLYLVSGETCICERRGRGGWQRERGVTHTSTMLPSFYMNQWHRQWTQIKLHISSNFPTNTGMTNYKYGRCEMIPTAVW